MSQSQAQRVSLSWPGGESLDPTPDEVLAVMALPYGGNWGPYQPVGEIEWFDPARPPTAGGRRERAAQLILIRHPERGWYFEYDGPSGPGGSDEWLAPLDPAGPPGHLRHWCWGEEQWFRAASFVPDVTARQVVADFLASGRPSAAITWAPQGDVGSRLYDDEYAERFGPAPNAEPGAAADDGG
ncbi:hypothetical protein [Gemmata obscuriglobus]|uniref:hypothetical protein n=1 Tax=Gemmata obscuriglobus TaxID=114 RepID=UPI0011CEAF51|nr:hypothetical protein [Gemmata obscuriglobus]